MFGIQLLDVAIGLIFIFLLLSLVVSATNELVSSILARRSKFLREGIEKLLHDPVSASHFMEHPLIRSLRRTPGRFPSYIPSRIFALALLDIISPAVASAGVPGQRLSDIRAALMTPGGAPISPQVAHALTILLDDAEGSLEAFKQNIEIWFNNSMERVSGWYKRSTQYLTVLIAGIVTVGFNADTISIAKTLWADPAIRSTLVAQAESYVRQSQQISTTPEAAEMRDTGPPPPPLRLPYEGVDPEQQFEESIERIRSLDFPLGWRDAPAGDGAEQLVFSRADALDQWPGGSLAAWLTAFRVHSFGWILTMLAISLGAPFWFDMLNKVVAVRSSGKAPEEKQKDPKVVPRPRESGNLPVEPPGEQN